MSEEFLILVELFVGLSALAGYLWQGHKIAALEARMDAMDRTIDSIPQQEDTADLRAEVKLLRYQMKELQG